MNVRVLACLAAAAILLPTTVRALDDFSDEALERSSGELDSSLDVIRHEVEAEYSDSVKFEAKLKEERLEFERELLDKRRRFLESLRALPPDRRADAYRLFRLSQSQRRAEFFMKEQERRDKFDSEEQRQKRKRRREEVDDYEDTGLDRALDASRAMC